MDFPKHIKDVFSKLLQEPTLDNFRDFIKGNTGKYNTVDFKSE